MINIFKTNLLFILILCSTIISCSTETLVHSVHEKEANEIFLLLSQSGIDATKVMNAEGREVVYDITVSSGNKVSAYALLNKNNYPRDKLVTYSDVFASSGIIPTAAQEKAKMLMALEGEIERQLLLVEGVIDAQVNLNMPEESALRAGEPPPPATASVVLKVSSRGIDTENIARLVANSANNLSRDRVQVTTSLMGAGKVKASDMAQVQGVGILGRLSANAQRGVLILAALLVMVLAGFIMFLSMNLRKTKYQFSRLQDEIIKARRARNNEIDSLPEPS